MTLILSSVLSFIFGYLLGSIPFGLILTRAAGGPDVRSIGSGNIGATNVLRTGRKAIAGATLLCDMLKGTAAVWAIMYYGLHHFAELSSDFFEYVGTLFIATRLAAIGAFLGHLFPVWLKFKGGKGVATYIGILLGIYWPGALIFCAIWLVVAVLSRYSSLAALIASALTPFALWGLSTQADAIVFLMLTVLLWIKHRKNIARLLDGSEGKIAIRTTQPK